jgi:hypothetical protein
MSKLLEWLFDTKMGVLLATGLLLLAQIACIGGVAWVWHSFPIAPIDFQEGHLVWFVVVPVLLVVDALFVLFVERVIVPLLLKDLLEKSELHRIKARLAVVEKQLIAQDPPLYIVDYNGANPELLRADPHHVASVLARLQDK